MIKYFSYKRIFELFLDAHHVTSTIERTIKGFRTSSGSPDFRLTKKENSIILHQDSLELDGGVYVHKKKIFLFSIKEDMGNIYVTNEKRNKVLTLTDTHSILKVEKDVFVMPATRNRKLPIAKTKETDEEIHESRRVQLSLFYEQK